MITYAQIGLLVLQIAKWFLDRASEQKSYNEGVQKEVAREAASIMLKNEFAKKMMEKVNAMSRTDLDALLDEFTTDAANK